MQGISSAVDIFLVPNILTHEHLFINQYWLSAGFLISTFAEPPEYKFILINKYKYRYMRLSKRTIMC